MPNAQPSLFARDDTFFGTCEAIGQDFGFNANYLRVAFGASLLWNPAAVLGIYVALSVVVMVSRWLAPARSVAAQQPVVVSPNVPVPAVEAAQPLKGEYDEPAMAFAAAA